MRCQHVSATHILNGFPGNIILWWVFWPNIIYTPQHIHLSLSIPSSGIYGNAAILPSLTRNYCFFHASRKQPSSEYAPFLGGLARMLKICVSRVLPNQYICPYSVLYSGLPDQVHPESRPTSVPAREVFQPPQECGPSSPLPDPECPH